GSSQSRLETVAQHLATNVPRASPYERAGDVRARLVHRSYESVADVAVCEDDRLIGLVTIEALLAAADDAEVRSISDHSPPIVAPGVDQEIAAWIAVQHGESSLAVVDASGRFLGLVPPVRLLRVLLAEHDEDVARLGGLVRATASARSASEERVPLRFWHRLPWLVVGLGGAMAASVVVGSFEHELRRNVTIAFFLPGIVYLADAVGTQTEALVIRGLSVGVGIRSIVGRELLTGAAIGVALAALFLPFAWLAWDQVDLAVAVSIALFLACSIATFVAMMLPWLLSRLGRDPVFGSGRLATVVQDLLSIVVYFLAAIWIAG
ncbi:MAG: magnesium transporter, partial [Dehalococcoidia bacterium]